MNESDRKSPLVVIVTAIHNGREHTRRLLASIEAVDYPSLRAVVVDDGSTDGSAEMIAENFPWVEVIQGSGELWWAGATNVGIDRARALGCDYVYITNNDVTLDPGAVTACVEVAEREALALVGSKIYEAAHPDRVWYFGARFDRKRGHLTHVAGPDVAFDRESTVEMLTGMGTLIPIQALTALNGLDSGSFPQYFADFDLSLRARALGYRLLVTPHAKLYNDVSSAWPDRQVKSGNIALLIMLFLADRSNFGIRVRSRFYRRHWGRGHLWALIRSYRGVGRTYLAPVTWYWLRKIVRRGR